MWGFAVLRIGIVRNVGSEAKASRFYLHFSEVYIRENLVIKQSRSNFDSKRQIGNSFG
jgi:hypothetical protein